MLVINACRLSDEADDACRSTYWRTRAAATLAPSYVVQLDGDRAYDGLVWTIAVDVPREGWGDHFALGIPKAEVPDRSPAFIGFAASLAWFPNRAVDARLVIRARVISLPWPSTPAHALFHLSAGAGATWSTFGFAPRLELKVRAGHLAWGGLHVTAGFQPYLSRDLFLGDVSVGLDAPWVWWW